MTPEQEQKLIQAAEGGIVYPCHMCKQLFWESSLRSGKNIEIMIVKNGEIAERFFIKDIMNYAWPK
jgi:cytidine deaminase